MYKKEIFEVQCLREGRWIIETSLPNQAEAEAFARRQLEKREVAGAKILREKGSGGSQKVVFSKIKEKREEKLTAGRIDTAPACRTVDECLQLRARMAMNRLLRTYLDKYALTPIEVLHNYREFKRLQDHDRLVGGALNQVAALQSENAAESMSVSRRADTLYGYASEIGKRTKDVETLQLPSIKQLGLDATFARIAAGAGDSAANVDFLFRVAVSRDLIETRSHFGKLERLLHWINDSQDDGAVRRLDDFVADILGVASVVQDLLGEQPSLAAAVSKLLDIAFGQWQAPSGVSRAAATDGTGDSIVQIARLVQEGRLPASSQVLVERVRVQLGGAKPLVRNDPDLEITSFRQILDRLMPDAALPVGGSDLVDALVQRKMRILNRGGAAGYRAAATWMATVMLDPLRKTRFLVALAQTPTARRFPDETVGLIDDVFVNVESISDIVKARVPPNEKMAGITQVWGEIRGSALPTEHVERICTRLDELLVQFVKSERILEKINDPSRPLRMRTMMLMKLCLPTSLPPGNASNLARAIIVGMLKRPNFEGEVVADIADPAEKARTQRDLFVLMRQAGFM